jgi:hypothetical protein
MATTTPRDATRQQLDELDALLQKMLALPVAAAEPPAPPPPAPPKFPPAAVAYGLPPAADFAANSAAPAGPANPAPKKGWAIDLNPRESSSVLGERSPLAGAEGPAAKPALSLTSLPSPIGEPPPRPSPRSLGRQPLWVRPLAAASGRFDRLMLDFGFVGRIVVSPAGRGLMGYAGLAMLAASAAWCVLAWVGWSW